MQGAQEALKEHHGIILSASVINKVTQEIGAQARTFNSEIEPPEKSNPLLIVEIDGSMVPIVEYGEANEKQKKSGLKHDRNCHWKEFRLCTVSVLEESKTTYGITRGLPFEAGCMMYETCRIRGMNEFTHIHGVGDGAPWIAEQYEEQFGANHEFLIDFFHVSEYLGEASKVVGSELEGREWYKAQREKLRTNREHEVVKDLEDLYELNPELEPIEKCLRYLANRIDHLNYASAIAEDLPIGSGEVESGHRSVLQKRLKKPGAWWTMANAETMAHLKTLQANGLWSGFWEKIAA